MDINLLKHLIEIRLHYTLKYIFSPLYFTNHVFLRFYLLNDSIDLSKESTKLPYKLSITTANPIDESDFLVNENNGSVYI